MSFKIRHINNSDKLSFLNLAQNDRERGFIKISVQASTKNDTFIYVLENNNECVGFLALSASRVDSIPSVLVDYIFIAPKYRKECFEELDNAKISEFLLSFAVETAKTIQKSIGVRWLALLPDNDKLEAYYKENFGFTHTKIKQNKHIYFLKFNLSLKLTIIYK